MFIRSKKDDLEDIWNRPAVVSLSLAELSKFSKHYSCDCIISNVSPPFSFFVRCTLLCIFLTISIYAIGLWRVYEPAPTMLESFTMKIFPSRWLLAGFPKSYDKTDYGRKNPLFFIDFWVPNSEQHTCYGAGGQRDIKHTIGWHIKWRRKRMA